MGPPTMVAATPDRVWLPLGNAQIIDWKHLDRDASARGATAWVGSVGGDSCLVRTWCEETTTHFDFAVLSEESLQGRVTLRVARPEPSRLDVRVEANVAGVLGYTETTTFIEHPRTGLQGSATRELDVASGRFDPSGCPRLTAPQAEIFEFSPESALHTDCGHWLLLVLTHFRGHLVDGRHELGLPDVDTQGFPGRSQPESRRADPEPKRPADLEARRTPEAEPPRRPPESEARRAPEPEPRRAPEPEPPRRAPEPEPEARRAAEPEARRGPESEVRRAPPAAIPTPAARAPTPAAPRARRLFASTNAGDSWEITDEETYIGRSKQCTVVLKSQRVSRKHASVTREGDAWYINDLGAANGIWAGTDKIDREHIEDGSEYIIGDVLLTFTYS